MCHEVVHAYKVYTKGPKICVNMYVFISEFEAFNAYFIVVDSKYAINN
jgi:hypothetical protein